MQKRRGLMLVLVWFSLWVSAPAQWRVVSQSKPASLGRGAWQVTKNLDGPREVELKLVFFDTSQCTLRIVDQPRRNDAVSLDRAMRRAHAMAGSNGGFFTPDFAPLGLEVASGKRIGARERSSLLTGLIVVRKSKPYVLWRDEFEDLPGITDAIQAGPRLVSAGDPIRGLDSTKRRPRTFVITDKRGHLAIGTCRSASLAALADILVTPKVIREFGVERALNLDGGSSTGFWWRDARGTEHYDRESATVKNFLAVVPRERE